MTDPDNADHGPGRVGDVLVTEELVRRPPRAPDFGAESRALAALARELAASPGTVLQRLAELVVELCRADSAGISILEPGGEFGIFRWPAAAGPFAAHVGGTMLREASPCGTVIERDMVLLFDRAERVFPALRGVEPPIFENLLAPFHLRGELSGTVWAITHDPGRRFDAEDARLLSSLAGFASAAWQTVTALEAAEAGRRDLEHRVEERTRALQASEERYRTIVESATDHAIIATDREGRVTGWSPGAEHVTGWPEAEVLGRAAALIFTPEDRAAGVPEAEMRRALAEGRAADERWLLRRNGSRFWGSGQLSPLHDSGRPGFLKVVSDRTAQRRTEEKLRESEERLRRFGDASSDVLWIRDAETLQWEYLTPAFERIYGMERGRALSGDDLTNWAELIIPEDREHALGSIRRVLEGERVVFEYRIRRPSDGEVRWLRDTDFPLLDENARVRHIGGIGHDITEIREAEARLRESEARLRTIVDVVPQIAWTARPDGHHDYYNRRWYEYTGLSEEQSEAQGWTTVIHPDDLGRTQERWGRSVRTGEDYEIEYRFRGVDGAYRWFIARGLPVRDTPDAEHPEGRIARWFGTCTDIEDMVRAREVLARSREELEAQVTARTAELRRALETLRTEMMEHERAEEALRQAQKMEAIGQLTGGVAHDINNMLQGIVGGLEMARRRVEKGRAAEAGRYLDAARDASDRAAALTNRLLAFARRQALDPRPVDPDRLAEGMAELIRRTVGPAIQVELRMGNGIWTVLCDPNQLESALLNLCINARDAMPKGGRLTISTQDVHLSAAALAGEDGTTPGDYVEVAVADTGVGMPPEVAARVFEPFFTTKPVGQGTGLGLSQIHGFVRQSGGVVRLESAPGKGTTVRLYLPWHERARAEEDRPTAAEPGRADAGETLLLVEDETTVRELAAERLRELGYRVLEAADGPMALRALRGADRLDLLVTDVGLPGALNGRQVADAARERWPALPVLFITGYAGGALEGRLAPGMAVIGKPFALGALAEHIGGMLGNGR
jgi:PAS domain S-box-containing protein